MIKTFIIILSLLSSTISMAQTLNFENALKSLFFGVDVKESANTLVSKLLAVPDLHHREKVNRQRSLSINLRLHTDKEAWSERHTFTFTKSPLPGSKIHSGFIEVLVGKAPGIEKLLDVNWCVQFENKNDAESFYSKLKEIFSTLSTKQKTEYDKDVGYLAQYSTRNEDDKGIRDIGFCLNKSLQTKKYQIILALINDFVDE